MGDGLVRVLYAVYVFLLTSLVAIIITTEEVQQCIS